MARQVRPAPDIPDMEVLRQIGGGAYGEIWMARSVTDTLRAVKVVYRDDFDDEKTFEREFEGILKYEPLASCLLYTSPSPRDLSTSRMPSSA